MATRKKAVLAHRHGRAHSRSLWTSGIGSFFSILSADQRSGGLESWVAADSAGQRAVKTSGLGAAAAGLRGRADSVGAERAFKRSSRGGGGGGVGAAAKRRRGEGSEMMTVPARGDFDRAGTHGHRSATGGWEVGPPSAVGRHDAAASAAACEAWRSFRRGDRLLSWWGDRLVPGQKSEGCSISRVR